MKEPEIWRVAREHVARRLLAETEETAKYPRRAQLKPKPLTEAIEAIGLPRAHIVALLELMVIGAATHGDFLAAFHPPKGVLPNKRQVIAALNAVKRLRQFEFGNAPIVVRHIFEEFDPDRFRRELADAETYLDAWSKSKPEAQPLHGKNATPFERGRAAAIGDFSLAIEEATGRPHDKSVATLVNGAFDTEYCEKDIQHFRAARRAAKSKREGLA